MKKDGRIYIAGHTGLFGRCLIKKLTEQGYTNLLLVPHSELDLTDQEKTRAFFLRERPEYVFAMAGLVGGIMANRERMADFTLVNAQIAVNLIESAQAAGVRKLLYPGSSCAYPAHAAQPITEAALLTGSLEPTNEGFAIAKILGVRLCEYYRKQYGAHFISCIPANVYGPGDHFSENNNHVIPALIQRIDKAARENLPEVEIWGSGRPKREFLYIDDAAEALIFLMAKYDGDGPINIGRGTLTSVAELAELIKREIGYSGTLVYDTSKPDGMMERSLDISKIESMGWRAKTSLEEGIRETYRWFRQTGGKHD